MKKFIEPANILMLDLETLDTKVTSEVAEVAALFYSKRRTVSHYHTYVSTNEELKPFFTVSEDTIKFHIQNNTNVLEKQFSASIRGEATKLSELINKLNNLTFTLPDDTMVYCFGATFDLPILSYVAQQTNSELALPSYRNIRCLRTELATAEKLGYKPIKLKTEHNAMADCIAQQVLLFDIFDFYKGLTNGASN